MRLVVLFLFLWIATTPAGHAFVTTFNAGGAPTRWNLVGSRLNTHPNVVNPQTRAVRYFLGSNTYSAANRAAELQALRNCFLQWQTVPGTILKFEEGGVMPGRVDVNTQDNTNLVFWVTTTTLVNNQMDDISGATGVTFTDMFSDNSIAEADTVLNGTQYGWFTDYNNPVAGHYFVESITLHELGHFIGLDHSPLGGTTMYTRSGTGLSIQSQLSADELAGVRYLYPAANFAATLAQVSGRVTMNGANVAGAVVIAEDGAGNAMAGTVTRTDGRYDCPSLAPGNYGVRVVPLDPLTAPSSAQLTTIRDIINDPTDPIYLAAQTTFLPTTNKPVALTAGRTQTLNITLTAGAPAFRVSRIRTPVTNPEFLIVVNSAEALQPGQRNLFAGVYSPNLPGSDATLTVTGDGLTIGPTLFKPQAFPGLNLISVELSVAENATPGLRTLVVRQGNNIAYANGFLRVMPVFPDINRDAFDDRFQRQYFTTPFAPEAAAHLDPDRDGFNNQAEYISGSSPVDAASVLRVESVRWDASGATVRWRSAPGRRYQVSSRPDGNPSRGWANLGIPVVATGDVTEFLDSGSSDPNRLYRIQALP